MRTFEDTEQLLDLGDAVVETKGTQIVGAPDQLSGLKIGMGLTDED